MSKKKYFFAKYYFLWYFNLILLPPIKHLFNILFFFRPFVLSSWHILFFFFYIRFSFGEQKATWLNQRTMCNDNRREKGVDVIWMEKSRKKTGTWKKTLFSFTQRAKYWDSHFSCLSSFYSTTMHIYMILAWRTSKHNNHSAT